MKLKIILFAILLQFSIGSDLFGQLSNRTTAEEINIQKVFLEANKHKLLAEYEDAARLFNEVLSQDKQNAAAAYELSRVEMAQEKYGKALEAINLAIRIDDQMTWYLMLKADILEAQNELSQAAEVYEQLTRLDPNQPHNFEHLHELYMKTKDLDKALENLMAYEKVAGITEAVIRSKFDVYNELGQPDQSLREVDKLIKLYPENLDYLQLAAAYSKQVENEEKAVEYYKMIIAIDPDDSRANLALAGSYKTDGDDLSYLNSIREIIKNPSINLDVKIQELIPYVEKISVSRDTALELTLFDLVELLDANHSHEAKIQAMLGDLYFATDQMAEARKAYENTLALNDGVFPVWDQLLYILHEQKDWESLIKVSAEAMDVFPNQGRIFYYNALGFNALKDYEEAQSSLTQALIMSSRDKRLQLDILSLLGFVHAQLGQVEKSNTSFDKAMAISKKDPILLERMGDTYLFQNESEKAVSYWKLAIDNGGDEKKLKKKLDAVHNN